MSRRDLLGQIADARARMQMRGYDPLVLEMGPTLAQEFRRESEIADLDDWAAALWGVTVRIRQDMEGFAVVPALAA
jgi:hypothetical protein